MDQAELAKAFGAFFAVMNPFINLPIFLALTANRTPAEQRALALKVTIFAAVMSVVIMLSGSAIIAFFGITIDQFRVAGGAVLAHIAWSMLDGTGMSSHHGSDQERGHMGDLSAMAFYPLTFPMVVGPGTITTLILYAAHAETTRDMLEVWAIVGSILLLLFVVLFFSAQIGRLMSETMRVITTRLMGLILLAISVGMIVAGVSAVFPRLVAG
ncbi:MarC family protein [Novosphingobium rosa]|uniref:MarC family protein n=1 Tax=Novosphingobium rosa TaxID=76978 RepID=UPI000829F767|nr:MarC family protein [Novosphingobium rosa]